LAQYGSTTALDDLMGKLHRLLETKEHLPKREPWSEPM
jgi:hypothetical protein